MQGVQANDDALEMTGEVDNVGDTICDGVIGSKAASGVVVAGLSGIIGRGIGRDFSARGGGDEG
jgi:hypothetical protein